MIEDAFEAPERAYAAGAAFLRGQGQALLLAGLARDEVRDVVELVIPRVLTPRDRVLHLGRRPAAGRADQTDLGRGERELIAEVDRFETKPNADPVPFRTGVTDPPQPKRKRWVDDSPYACESDAGVGVAR